MHAIFQMEEYTPVRFLVLGHTLSRIAKVIKFGSPGKTDYYS